MKGEELQLFMFHFRCPVCGAEPGCVPLRDYLEEWRKAAPERISSLLCVLSGAMLEARHGSARWASKKFLRAAGRIKARLATLCDEMPIIADSSLGRGSDGLMDFHASCPACLTGPGPRDSNKYFTVWPDACKVQVANLLYEVGLMLWAVISGLPNWASGDFLDRLNSVRLELRRTGKSISLLECPQCGRLTTCLYGSPHPKQTGFCRWCFDMGGGSSQSLRGFFISLGVNYDADGNIVLEVPKPEFGAPASNAQDILPPEITQRWKLPSIVNALKTLDHPDKSQRKSAGRK